MNPWDLIIVQPVTNILIVMSDFMAGYLGLAIIVLTIIVNLLMYPLTLKQIRATKAMQSLQPKLAELQKKHAKDKSKLAQEQMKLYKESGVSPAGCLLPMLIQLPVWIALFQSIMRLVAEIPENFIGLSRFLYPWSVVYTAIPLENNFLWLDLGAPDRLLILPILVGGTMWLQQKMTTVTGADPRQQSMNRMMLWIMPLMFAFITLQFPSGLALYWVTSSVIRIAMQYFITGRGALMPGIARKPVAGRDTKYMRRISQVEQVSSTSADVSADVVEPSSEEVGETGSEKSGDIHPERSGGYPEHLQSIRRRPKRGRSHRPKRR